MPEDKRNINAEVIAVYPNKVKISVDDLSKFVATDEQVEKLKVGSYLEIADDDNHKLIAIIESYSILVDEKKATGRSFIIEANPLGIIEDKAFTRGGDSLTIPPTKVVPAKKSDIEAVFNASIKDEEKFYFSRLGQDLSIKTPVNGNKFFNKHFAIVGSTGSGKSHTVAKILQNAVSAKKGQYNGLNNSHVVLFDIHGEYKKAFPKANHIDSQNIKIPYWLFDSDELGDLFIESNEDNSHNQVSQFRYAVTENKKKENPSLPQDKIYFDSPLKFKIDEVITYIKNMNNEFINKKDNRNPTTKSGEAIKKRIPKYFENILEFEKISSDYVNGPYSGDFERFILRLETIRNNPRLKFLFDSAESLRLEDILRQFFGYAEPNSNITVIDLSGIPFEVLSITVSLISRILFEFGYYYKKLLNEDIDCETPLLLVYEEAHKYVPRSDLVKYRASKTAIERIAKEGRKYGVTLGIVSQRPSEISETIFSQCNNFIAMRLTNPDDQNYVKRLLPDSLGNLTDTLPSLKTGEALIIGDSMVLPSIVKIDKCTEHEPSSNDIPYIEIWQEQWKNVSFSTIITEWEK
ncbi:ATP-binding protein [Desulfosporosinus nitroreducens]|uniref:ATP-binding protein n=1 Tax=Desulfosporosinus nitroreducens TaxID=2018668 RepID=A0ABT8QRP0_9FIRM|nr:ATP-binding protein [Desulfosporosinus nitroreducens]MDO0823320.1 ATP-binding protein [Desulfosporosinus nitroreducens]